MWFIGVEVEQGTSAPPPKKILDPPLVQLLLLLLFLLFVFSVAVAGVVVSITGSKIPQTHSSPSLFPVLI